MSSNSKRVLVDIPLLSIGYQAGDTIVGSYNVAIDKSNLPTELDYSLALSRAEADSFTNTVVIGKGLSATGSNQLIMGNKSNCICIHEDGTVEVRGDSRQIISAVREAILESLK